MGNKYEVWRPLSDRAPADYDEVAAVIQANRQFSPVDDLDYGDYGLDAAYEALAEALRANKRIALYADYDVDGTMSCVSWIWFLKAIGFDNFVHYIPDRFKEGYGLNLQAVEHLIENERAELIITMDTGITANEEAAFCRERGVQFVCTDHHKVQPEKMPDCIVLNPKLHPDENYQELCGCGITFVLLRKLGREFQVPANVWTDILALTGMATICDVVPLNGVNHRLARLGVQALKASRRPVLVELLRACQAMESTDEQDIGFRLGPRINAVGRLEHANIVIDAFVSEDSRELIRYMGSCNERRKVIQNGIVQQAGTLAAEAKDVPCIFLGGDWHQGVVGIAASKLAEEHWKPTWLFQRGASISKGSARSIPGFDVTDAMAAASDLFEKFGGHKAAGGYSFATKNEQRIRERLTNYVSAYREKHPEIWRSKIDYDCELSLAMTELDLVDTLQSLKPFGHCFTEPRFRLNAQVFDCRYYNDKTTGEPKHTALQITGAEGPPRKVMFFNQVIDFKENDDVELLVTASRNVFRGKVDVTLMGIDYQTS